MPTPQSAVLNYEVSGVLALTLESDGYAWEFIPVAGSEFTDTGRGECH